MFPSLECLPSVGEAGLVLKKELSDDDGWDRNGTFLPLSRVQPQLGIVGSKVPGTPEDLLE